MSKPYGYDAFVEAHGRAPLDEAELRGDLFRKTFLTRAEPGERARAERIVRFAEEEGGDVLAFAKAHWGYYWGPAMPRNLTEVEQMLGMTEDRAAEVMALIFRATRERA